MHRKQLLASDIAVCFYCFTEFLPGAVQEWTDGEPIGHTALCPYCGVDAVVGFNGPVDAVWVTEAHNRGFN